MTKISDRPSACRAAQCSHCNQGIHCTQCNPALSRTRSSQPPPALLHLLLGAASLPSPNLPPAHQHPSDPRMAVAQVLLVLPHPAALQGCHPRAVCSWTRGALILFPEPLCFASSHPHSYGLLCKCCLSNPHSHDLSQTNSTEPLLQSSAKVTNPLRGLRAAPTTSCSSPLPISSCPFPPLRAALLTRCRALGPINSSAALCTG